MVDSSAPLYVQIATRLRAQIADGQYALDAKIPSEHELAAHFSVGRPTVRQATELLVSEGVLERRRGSGTYVREAPPEVDLFSAGGTLAAFARSGTDLSTKLLKGPKAKTLASTLEHPLAGKAVYFLARLGSYAEVPVLLEEMVLAADVFAGLDRLAVRGRSLSELAQERYLLRLSTIDQRFGLARVDGDRALTLDLEPGSPVLRVERTISFQGAPNAVFVELFCRTDQVTFTQTLSFERGTASVVASPARTATPAEAPCTKEPDITPTSGAPSSPKSSSRRSKN